MHSFAAISAALFVATASQAGTVDIELTLLVDRSGGVSASEYTRQVVGYTTAFKSLNFESVVGAGRTVAVNYIEWSGPTDQSVRSVTAANPDGWWVLSSQADCNEFAAFLSGLSYQQGTSSAPQDALAFAVRADGGGMFHNTYHSTRQIIDVSGSVMGDAGLLGTAGRDAALAAGVDMINTLVVSDQASSLSYYANNIQSDNGFTLQANDFDAFTKAISDKLRMELMQVIPLPSTAALGLLGLGAVASLRRRASLNEERSS